MKKITRKNLMAALKQLNGVAIASIDSITEVKLTGGKKNPHKDRPIPHLYYIKGRFMWKQSS